MRIPDSCSNRRLKMAWAGGLLIAVLVFGVAFAAGAQGRRAVAGRLTIIDPSENGLLVSNPVAIRGYSAPAAVVRVVIRERIPGGQGPAIGDKVVRADATGLWGLYATVPTVTRDYVITAQRLNSRGEPVAQVTRLFRFRVPGFTVSATDPFVILQPHAGDRINGGVVQISGLARPYDAVWVRVFLGDNAIYSRTVRANDNGRWRLAVRPGHPGYFIVVAQLIRHGRALVERRTNFDYGFWGTEQQWERRHHH